MTGIIEEWFNQNDCLNDVASVIDVNNGHVLGGLFTYALVCANDLGNGWDHAHVDSYDVVRNRDIGTMYVLNPPPLDGAHTVIGLDGTPAPMLWNMVLGTELEHVPILSAEQRRTYLNDTMGITVVQCTSDAAYPNGNGNNTNTCRDAALYAAIAVEHGDDIPVIAPKAAFEQYDDGVLTPVSDHEHYGNLKGSNQFKDTTAGIVNYSTHYGDGFMQRWAALTGKSTDRVDGTDGMETAFDTEIGNEGLC